MAGSYFGWALKGPVSVSWKRLTPERVQLVVELDGRLAGFDHRPGGAGEATDVGVGPEVIGAGDVPIAVPLGPTTA